MKIFLFILLIGIISFGLLHRAGVFGRDKQELIVHSEDEEYEFDVWLAETPEIRAKGLSGKFRMNTNEGMLFVLGDGASADFWMKDMRFSIDILFLDSNYKVIEIFENLEPCHKNSICPLYSPRETASFALELKAGQVEDKRIKIGDRAELTD